ncbi:MAG: M20/M25/M40 family metallo-hydrolase, partial [Thermodesulfobacteriota bacterium]|nr:M20/M25/M40 family metallo-hydrolase [Thermodesulfobacteriota bacterium]
WILVTESALLPLIQKEHFLNTQHSFCHSPQLSWGFSSVIKGGIGPNTVPEDSTAFIDFRLLSVEDKKYVEEKIQAIVKKQHTPYTSSKVEILTSRPPMNQNPANRELFQAVKDVAKSLDLPIKEEFRAGASDANLIAQQNVPVIDGLGPMGGKDHSDDEYMIKESLWQRAALIACSIVQCCKTFVKV